MEIYRKTRGSTLIQRSSCHELIMGDVVVENQNKVVIHDPVKALSGQEVELPPQTSVRFEVGGVSFVCSIKEGGLDVRKSGSDSEGLSVQAAFSNNFQLR